MKHPRRIIAVMWLELLHLRRDRVTRALIVLVPALQLVLFGYAVNLDPRQVAVAIAGPDDGGVARRLVAQDSHFTLVADELPAGEAARRVEGGGALIGIELPAPGGANGVRVVVDGTDAAAVRPALAALERGVLRQMVGDGGSTLDVEWRYNPMQRTDWTVLPGLAGAVTMISMLMLGALTLVRERERGTWEGLMATPVTGFQVMAGKLAPYVPIGVAQTALVVALAAVLFDLPVRGELGILLLGAGLSAACYLAVGFTISALARTQMQAVQLAVMLYLPSMLLSGFMFPFQGMPGWAQAIGTVLPLTHFVRLSRDILLRGAMDGRITSSLSWLVALTVICTGCAIAAYRRRLD